MLELEYNFGQAMDRAPAVTSLLFEYMAYHIRVRSTIAELICHFIGYKIFHKVLEHLHSLLFLLCLLYCLRSLVANILLLLSEQALLCFNALQVSGRTLLMLLLPSSRQLVYLMHLGTQIIVSFVGVRTRTIISLTVRALLERLISIPHHEPDSFLDRHL